LRSGWSVARSTLLDKGGTLKKRPSPHLHKVLTQSNKVSPWTLQMALIKCSDESIFSDRVFYVLAQTSVFTKDMTKLW